MINIVTVNYYKNTGALQRDGHFFPLNGLRVMMISTSFHNNSAILWRSVLLVGETTDM
jgi:hypothetical protein